MDGLFEEIVEISEVSGVSVFVKTKILVSDTVSAIFIEELLSIVGSELSHMGKMGGNAGLSVLSSFFYLDKYRLVVRPLNEDISLLVICGSQADCAAVDAAVAIITRNVSGEELMLIAAKGVNEQLEEINPEAVDSDEMSQTYKQILVILTEVVGPLAEDIMHHCLQLWKQSGDAAVDRIPYLQAMLVEEIGDIERAGEFIEQMKDIY